MSPPQPQSRLQHSQATEAKPQPHTHTVSLLALPNKNPLISSFLCLTTNTTQHPQTPQHHGLRLGHRLDGASRAPGTRAAAREGAGDSGIFPMVSVSLKTPHAAARLMRFVARTVAQSVVLLLYGCFCPRVPQRNSSSSCIPNTRPRPRHSIWDCIQHFTLPEHTQHHIWRVGAAAQRQGWLDQLLEGVITMASSPAVSV